MLRLFYIGLCTTKREHWYKLKKKKEMQHGRGGTAVWARSNCTHSFPSLVTTELTSSNCFSFSDAVVQSTYINNPNRTDIPPIVWGEGVGEDVDWSRATLWQMYVYVMMNIVYIIVLLTNTPATILTTLSSSYITLSYYQYIRGQ